MKILVLYTIAIAVAAISLDHQFTKPVVKEKIVFAEYQVPACAPLVVPHDRKNYYGKQRDLIAAAIPANALREK